MTTGPLPDVVFTIGHSTRPAGQFLELLRAHGVTRIADVRTIPKSARHPQYNSEALDAFLHANGVVYRHIPALGGLRKPRANSVNSGWRHPAFRGYADYMQTLEFEAGLAELLAFAAPAPTAVMCAEAVWWQCHRQLLSDALLAVDVPVRHILDSKSPKPHRMSDFARVTAGKVSYPGLL